MIKRVTVSCMQVSTAGLGYGEGPDISPTSGTVEFPEGVTTALLLLTVTDDQVCTVCCV